jgi:hypothetical protein
METRICVDCRKEFTLSEAEQKYHAEKQKVDQAWQLPRRCKDCLTARRLNSMSHAASAPLHRPVVAPVTGTSPTNGTHAVAVATAPKPPVNGTPKACPQKKKDRLILATTDFEKLVNGCVVEWHGHDLEVILADIGFDNMRHMLDDAEFARFRTKHAS